MRRCHPEIKPLCGCVSHNNAAFSCFVRDHPDVLIGFAALKKGRHLPLLAEANLEQQDAARPQVSERVSRNPHMDAEAVRTGCECLARLELEQGGTVASEPRFCNVRWIADDQVDGAVELQT